MPSNYIANWIQNIDRGVLHWMKNPHHNRISFDADPLILSNHIEACKPDLDIQSFPEPYYFNADDSVQKSAVVLFYNPGKSDANNHRNGQFHHNLNFHKGTYSTLASNVSFDKKNVSFLDGTKTFLKSKKSQLDHILNHCGCAVNEEKPLFIDLVPWHSQKFGEFDISRFSLEPAKSQAIRNVIIPAVLNAENSLLTVQASTNTSDRKVVVFFCVGAKYSKFKAPQPGFLEALGFRDITKNVELMNSVTKVFNANIRYTMLTSAGDITFDALSCVRVWKIGWEELIRNLDLSDSEWKLPNYDSNMDIYAINIWNNFQGMNIPRNLDSTINAILAQLGRL
jgi:hypothetical protein